METMNIKLYKRAIFICLSVLLLTSCEDELGRTVYPLSQPVTSDFTTSVNEVILANDSLFFSLSINDQVTPLSTLEVLLSKGDDVIFSKSIRTKGNSVKINNYGIFIPFAPGQENGRDVTLSLTAINVEGSEEVVTKEFKINRPEIPSTIYLHYDDKVLPMTQMEDNPFEYVTEEGEFPETLTGKISTSESLENSDIIWGYSESINSTSLINKTGAGFNFNFEDWQIDRIKFNSFTFELGVEGFISTKTINGVELIAESGMYNETIHFTKGEEVIVTGFENLKDVYNRDFFSYDEENGILTFLRESGDWEVSYSSAYNYIWVTRQSDVAPDAFWIVGHGFTGAPVWNDDFNYDGWTFEDVTRMGYTVKIAENKYQCTLFISDTHEWGSFEFEIYSDKEWGKDNGIVLQDGSILGSTGFSVSGSNGLTNGDNFVSGYYRLTFDTSGGVGNETVNIEKLD